MKSKQAKPILLLLAILVVCMVSNGAQRMGIASGKYNIGPRGSARIPSFCMDFTREAPAKGTSYRHVLTDPRKATVRFGTGTQVREMKLDKALRENLLSIEGQNLDGHRIMEMLSDQNFVSRLDGETRSQLRVVQEGLQNLSPSERQEVEAVLQQQLQLLSPETIGDFTGLKFKNNTADAVQITLEESMILSDKQESLGLLDGSNINLGKQDNIWELNNRRYAKKLTESGVPLPEIGGEPFRSQVEKFQAALDLTGSHGLDTVTELALDRVHREQTRVSFLNSESEHSLHLTFETAAGGETEFRAFYGKGEEIYRGNSLNSALREANARLEKGDRKALCIDLVDFGETRAQAIEANLRRVQAQIAAERDLYVISRGRTPVAMQNLLFERGINQFKTHVIEEIPSGPRKGWFGLTVEFIKKTGEMIRIRLVSATRKGLELFQTHFGQRNTTPSILSPMDEILLFKEQLKKLGIPTKDLILELEGSEVGFNINLGDETRAAA